MIPTKRRNKPTRQSASIHHLTVEAITCNGSPEVSKEREHKTEALLAHNFERSLLKIKVNPVEYCRSRSKEIQKNCKPSPIILQPASKQSTTTHQAVIPRRSSKPVPVIKPGPIVEGVLVEPIAACPQPYDFVSLPFQLLPLPENDSPCEPMLPPAYAQQPNLLDSKKSSSSDWADSTVYLATQKPTHYKFK